MSWKSSVLLTACTLLSVGSSGNAMAQIRFHQTNDELVIRNGEQPIATYVFRDTKIPRPYFAHVRSPEGIQVTRNHPPIEGTDRLDHDTMHPGIWMAFGDLGGSDFWRNKATVAHVRFVSEPAVTKGIGTFVEEKQYRRPDGSIVCRESFRCAIHPKPGGWLLIWDSTFRGDAPFSFGDQEEMGLGIRVATPLSEIEGGQLTDSEGRTGAATIWSHSSGWCDYSGVIDDKRVGMTLMCHPDNFRESWMHARDYGFVAANPFGREAMKKGERSSVAVLPEETLRLRYAVWIHSGDAGAPSEIQRTYDEYRQLTDERKP